MATPSFRGRNKRLFACDKKMPKLINRESKQRRIQLIFLESYIFVYFDVIIDIKVLLKRKVAFLT